MLKHMIRIMKSMYLNVYSLKEKNIKVISISNFTGTEFPNWLGYASFHNLGSLCLESCKYCYVLPPLGQLPSLKQLEISNFETLEIVGREFYWIYSCVGNGIQSFASLEILKFNNMQTWEKWSHPLENENGAAFPHLKQLLICNYPRLIGDLPKTLPSLQRLLIQDSGQIVSPLPSAIAISKLGIHGCPNPRLPVYLDANQCYQSLELLVIRYCHALKSFPLDLLPKLKSLEILHCENIESLTVAEEQQLIAHHFLSIYGCPNFVSFPDRGFAAPNLTSLSIECCPKLKFLPHSRLLSLEELRVLDCPEIVPFPDADLSSRLRLLGFSNWVSEMHQPHLHMPKVDRLNFLRKLKYELRR